MARILLFDDDETILRACTLYLREKGHEPFPSQKPETAAELARAVKPDLVITDLMMPGMMGGGVYEAIRKECGPELPVIICSGMRLKLHVTDPKLTYCPKPLDLDMLLECVAAALKTNKGDIEG